MRDDIILKLQRIIEGNDRITWDLFPAIYDGFLEANELSLAEDRMLQLVASAVQTATNDKIISTASAEKVAEYEDVFGLSAAGLTLDERRQQVIDYINRSRVINEETLHDLCQSLAPGYTVYEKTDPQALTLGIFTEEDDAQGHLPAVGIVDEIRPTVPQNLALYAGVETSFSRGVVVSHAHFSALWAGLGTVERQVPDGAIRGGLIGEASESVYTSEKWSPNTVGELYLGFGIMAEVAIQEGGTFRLHPDYTPVFPAYEFRQYDGTENTNQLAGGTLRLFGTNANQEVEIAVTSRMVLGDLQLDAGGLVTGTQQMGGVVEEDTNA